MSGYFVEALTPKVAVLPLSITMFWFVAASTEKSESISNRTSTLTELSNLSVTSQVYIVSFVITGVVSVSVEPP